MLNADCYSVQSGDGCGVSVTMPLYPPLLQRDSVDTQLLGIFIFLNCKLCLHSIIGNHKHMSAQRRVEAHGFYTPIMT